MTREPIRLAWLFDVDGTLLLTDGAARESFAAAVSDTFGARDDLRDIAFAGRTEPLILADILDKHRRAFTDGDEQRFWERVFTHMRARLTPGRGRLLPGVSALLEAVESEPGWIMGLLTGNMTTMARIKLDHFGIASRFRYGNFGEEARDRNELACLAVGRLRRDYGVPASRCVVVGDTEHDIACARAAGAHVVAVATGSRRREELEACGPDLLLSDLTEMDRLMEWARRL
jgi:phosphoglycolate phosphatase-like HAD superfamily hydrolase